MDKTIRFDKRDDNTQQPGESKSMSIPTLVIVLTLLIALYGVIWHDETADGIRNESPNDHSQS